VSDPERRPDDCQCEWRGSTRFAMSRCPIHPGPRMTHPDSAAESYDDRWRATGAARLVGSAGGVWWSWPEEGVSASPTRRPPKPETPWIVRYWPSGPNGGRYGTLQIHHAENEAEAVAFVEGCHAAAILRPVASRR
jgi:hypothetical protein